MVCKFVILYLVESSLIKKAFHKKERVLLLKAWQIDTKRNRRVKIPFFLSEVGLKIIILVLKKSGLYTYRNLSSAVLLHKCSIIYLMPHKKCIRPDREGKGFSEMRTAFVLCYLYCFQGKVFDLEQTYFLNGLFSLHQEYITVWDKSILLFSMFFLLLQSFLALRSPGLSLWFFYWI